jgi:hypothetical protein
MATQKHIKKKNNNIRKNRKTVRAIRRVEEKTSAKNPEAEDNKKSLTVPTYNNVGDEYREYKKKLNNISQILSEIKELEK